ncbi:MAG: hypothetical protein IJ644_07465 [Oscillospiraceae bacterium]|nr:hypothetical protein [Oscillospiraceae bacterium]
MSELLERLKAYYTASKSNSFEWHDYYPNNMPDNGKEGSYTFFWFKKKDKFEFLKYTINYMSRCDEEGCSHPEEGTKYYVLHEFRKEYDRILKIPEPSDDCFPLLEEPPEGEFSSDIVNQFGRFRYVFDDEETARKVVSSELFQILYPYLYVLSEEEAQEWNDFIKE